MRLAIVFSLTLLSSALWGADPFLGTWKLDLSRSKFEPGPAPRSLTVVWAETPGGLKITATGVRANGQPIREAYTPVYDGKEYSRQGPWNFDAVVNRQVSGTEREDVFKKSGAVVGTSKLTISEGGRVLTVRFAYGDLRDIRVFERQAN